MQIFAGKYDIVLAFRILRVDAASAAAIGASAALSAARGFAEAWRASMRARVINAAVSSSQAKSKSGFRSTAASLLGSEALVLILALARDRATDYGVGRICRMLKSRLILALLSQDIDGVETTAKASLAVIWSVDHVISNLVAAPIGWLETIARAVATVRTLLRRSGRLALLMAFLLPARESALNLIYKAQEGLAMPEPSDNEAKIARFDEILRNVRAFTTMRSFARERIEGSIASKAIAEKDRATSHATMLYRFFDPLADGVGAFVECAALWFGGRIVANGEMEAGDLASYMMLSSGVFEQLRYMYHSLSQFSANEVAEIAHLLESVPKIGLSGGIVPETISSWDVQVRNVRFAYPQRPNGNALDDVTLCVPQGAHVGFAGDVGSGKSTLLKLLQRLYDPDEGAVFLGEYDVRALNPLWLRRQIAVVGQEPVLFTGSIRDNIAYGKEGAADAEITAAAKAADAHDFILTIGGYDASVGLGGSQLSGGQKQRIALARAFIKDPRILLLDEATAAMDAASQSRVLDSVSEQRKTKAFTTISVAHRLSALRDCDTIFCFRSGKIVERGSPAELLSKPNGMYRTFASLSQVAATP